MVPSNPNKQIPHPTQSGRRILKDMGSILLDLVEAARMGMLIVTEGHSRYYKSHPERNYRTHRWIAVVRVKMADETIIRWASKAMGGTHVTFDRTVGAWYTEASGARAVAVLARVRPFVIGEKTVMIDCILRNGKYIVSEERPCMDCESTALMERRIADLRHRGLLYRWPADTKAANTIDIS
jgi:hypothetical protein